MDRRCGDCELCCKLLPMTGDQKVHESARNTAHKMMELGWMNPSEFYDSIHDFDKPAGAKCPYQKHGKGCTIYNKRPFGCRIWNCRWLVSDDTNDLRRPDRSHYVIDIAPDFVVTDEGVNIPVIQVWVDKNYREAHRDPALREYLKRRWEKEGCAALIRWDNREDCMFLVWQNGEWFEKTSNMKLDMTPHSALEKAAVMSGKIILK